MLNRRTVLGAAVSSGAAGLLASQATAQATRQPVFTTRNRSWQRAYDRALRILESNVQLMPRYSKPVLIEGAVYQGIWMECGPHEALVYRKFRPDVAFNSHEVFFELQRLDGQLPCNNKVTETGFGQIQMVISMATTAWELAESTGNSPLLEMAYRGCSLWDAWLLKYRNVRGSGLTEAFCTYDTGHDNSPRFAGIPPQCPNKDAKRFPTGYNLPRLAPDLSATTYGARMAMAAMAEALGKATEADRWRNEAGILREKIIKTLYSEEDGAFYDLDAQNQYVRVRSDIISRVCGENVPDQTLFETLWQRQLHNPKAFWGKVPLSSIAMDDPAFVRPIPTNSWGGASQALTALRAPRWMEAYGKQAELGVLMSAWCQAIVDDMTFRQQLDPDTGEFTRGEADGYSPAALVMMDHTWRLAGVVETPDTLCWNVNPTCPSADGAQFALPTDTGTTATMLYHKGGATLTLGDKTVAKIDGTARLITDKTGKPTALLGISEKAQSVSLKGQSGRTVRVVVKPNARVNI